MTAPTNVLFLCTGNSARSVMAEVILNRLGAGRFQAFSAGSTPKGAVHPTTLKLLAQNGDKTDSLSSKSWDEFAKPGAPEMHIVVTVCDNAAGEVCPVWPGHPVQVHWSFPDPAAFDGPEDEELAYFREIYGQIERRLEDLVSIAIDGRDPPALKSQLQKLA